MIVKLYRNHDIWFLALALLLLVNKTSLLYSSMPVILLTGIFVSFAIRVLAAVRPKWRVYYVALNFVAPIFIAGLLAGLWYRGSAGRIYQYHDEYRWGGMWDNPNTCGELMGVGVVVTMGLLLKSCVKIQPGIGSEPEGKGILVKPKTIPTWLSLSFYSFGIGALGFGLFGSYSRGAWLGTGVGIGYLIWRVSSRRTWFRRNWIALSAVLLSLVVLSFWQFRFTESRPARRMFSVSNIDDFSWRNRLTTWEASARMIVDRPWIGFGWGNGELASRTYRPLRLSDGLAIELNDYFMLGISAGVPVLICFVVYVWLGLRERQMGLKAHEGTSNWTRVICRAGAVVLLVGFWFDGGLFKLATGSVFWILLELGRADSNDTDQTATASLLKIGGHARDTRDPLKRRPLEIWLRRSGWTLATAASLETFVLLGTPFLSVNSGTLAIARKWLVPPRAVGDLDFLATGSVWHDNKLRILLQHASLANYNRQLINWTLDEQIYRDYVLTPTIDPELDGDLHWRRALWEYFYPAIRKENEPQAASQIVLRYLYDRTALVPDGPRTIEEMWRQKKADKAGFEAIEVAAFRSVGVPARLNANKRVEIFAGDKWLVPAREVHIKI